MVDDSVYGLDGCLISQASAVYASKIVNRASYSRSIQRDGFDYRAIRIVQAVVGMLTTGHRRWLLERAWDIVFESLVKA